MTIILDYRRSLAFDIIKTISIIFILASSCRILHLSILNTDDTNQVIRIVTGYVIRITPVCPKIDIIDPI